MASRILPENAAVLYLRMSSAKQDKSIPAQRDELVKVAKQKGYQVIREYVDPGVSGDQTEKRDGFLKLRNDCENGPDFSIILCWHEDRFSRNDPLEYGYWLKPIRDSGVVLETPMGRVDWESLGGRLLALIGQEMRHDYPKDKDASFLFNPVRPSTAPKSLPQQKLITLGLAPFENQNFRTALFEQLGSSELEIPVTTDIVGRADAHAVRLDKEAAEVIRKAQLHRKIATTIFFESNGGMCQSRAEATLTEIRTGVSGPELNIADVDNVLEGLAGSCFYLNWERNRYRFGLAPNLNQILVTRRGAVEDKRIEERIKKDTETLFQPGSKELDRRFWPKRSNDVPNRAVLTMVVLGQDTPAEGKTTLQMMESIVRDCGSSGRTYKSALIFSAPDATTNVREAARNALAWEDIDDDEETKKRIDQSQLKLLQRNLEAARRQLREDLFRAYRHLYLLDKTNALKHIDLGQITSSATTPTDGIVGLYVRELRRTDEITDGVGPGKLIKYWPPALTETTFWRRCL